MNSKIQKILFFQFSWISSMFMILVMLVAVNEVNLVSAAPMPAGLPGWTYQTSLQILNNATSALPSGYTVIYTLDTATLVTGGQMLANCNDLRIVYNGGAEVELDRLVSGCNTATTQIQFHTQAAIGTSGTDTNYILYYGNPSAGTPPSNPANVFAFYDDFQGDTAGGDANGWTTKGTWGVVDDAGNYVYRYTTGGANWALSYATVPLSDFDYTARIRADTSTSWIGLAFRIQDNKNFLTFYESKDVSQFKFATVTNDNHIVTYNPPFTMGAGAWGWASEFCKKGSKMGERKEDAGWTQAGW
jgi:hypothetical protein